MAEAVRLVWLLASDWLSANKTTGKRFDTGKDTLRNTLVTTLSGPKGAVSLSIAMPIPTTLSSGAAFPQRDLLLFVTCGVIVLTLALAELRRARHRARTATRRPSASKARSRSGRRCQNVIRDLKRACGPPRTARRTWR